MVYSTKQMHTIAVAAAIAHGPRRIIIDCEPYVGYTMSKRELFKLFVEHGYSAGRTRWLNTIKDWGDEKLWNDIVPTNFMEPNVWDANVIFTNLSDEDKATLILAAENAHAKTIPRLPKEVFL